MKVEKIYCNRFIQFYKKYNMDRIRILKTEIETLEKNKSTQVFMKLINNDKLDSMNEQLKIIK